MLHQVASSFGRLPQKPEKKVEKEDVHDDDTIPIQDQIENLRSKISLKERYNRVLRDDLEESREGASSVLRDLYIETVKLRNKFMDAIFAEKTAVQSALRTHRLFQLAMIDNKPSVAVGWLEDKLFDVSKQLNTLLNKLAEKRQRLEESENMVIVIEKWPRPGSLPWERLIVDNSIHLENLIEAMKVKKETAMILHSKYKEIRMVLKEEKCKYGPNLRKLENQLSFHKAELANLEKMVEDAAHFREEAGKNLGLTEAEAYENRKKRRKQMNKMKRAVTTILEANSLKEADPSGKVSLDRPMRKRQTAKLEITEKMRFKQNEIDQFQDRARRLVQTMRVPNLTYIPQRLKSVMALGARLKMEQETKEQYRDLLIRHRDHLLMVLFFFKYTGQEQEAVYLKAVNKSKEETTIILKAIEDAEFRLHTIGDSNINTRLGIIAILGRIEGQSREKRSKLPDKDLLTQLKALTSKIKVLVKSVKNLRALFTTESDRNYAAKPKTPIPGRLIRVGSPVVSDESDADNDDFSDFKVPGRMEIKTRSFKFIHQSLLKRGGINS